MKNKIILIDWANTITYSKFWENLETKDKPLYDKVEHFLFKKNSDIVDDWMRGKYTSEDIHEIISKKLNIPYEKIFEEFINSCKQIKFASKKIPVLLKQIRSRGIKIYIFTDNMDYLERWTNDILKERFLFDGVVNSYNSGYLKKDQIKGELPLLKEIIIKEGVKPDDIIYFDDNEANINLYKSFGVFGITVTKDRPLVYFLKKITDS